MNTEKAKKNLFYIALVFAGVILQFVLLLVLDLTQLMSWIFGNIISGFFTQKSTAVPDIPLVFSYLLIIFLFGAFWFLYWRYLYQYYQNAVKWFYFNVVLTEIPIINTFALVKKVPDPDAMIPYQPFPLVNCITTGMILFPIYSICLYYFVFKASANKKRNAAILYAALLVLGVAVFCGTSAVLR